MLGALFGGLALLVRDHGQGRRLVHTLWWRVGLAGLTLALVAWGLYSGQLVSHARW